MASAAIPAKPIGYAKSLFLVHLIFMLVHVISIFDIFVIPLCVVARDNAITHAITYAASRS